MAKNTPSTTAPDWYDARDHYRQLKIKVDRMGPSTPLDESEEAEMALEVALTKLTNMNAPTLDGLCERIELYWGEKLFDELDPDMDMVRMIIGNLRWLERHQVR